MAATPLPNKVHVPPASGVPPRPVAKATGALLEHTFKVPLVPATGCGMKEIVTVDVAFTQAFPTRYVYTPAGSVAGSN